MTRKKGIKILMSRGFSKRGAVHMMNLAPVPACPNALRVRRALMAKDFLEKAKLAEKEGIEIGLQGDKMHCLRG